MSNQAQLSMGSREIFAAARAFFGEFVRARPPSFDLRGKNAVVTGGSRGLGLEVARALVTRGANVAIVARSEDDIARAVRHLHDLRGDRALRIVGQRCDLEDGASIDTMIAAVRETLGPIDVLVNNAGIIQVGPLDTMTFEDFEAAMKVHCFAPLRTALAVRDEMRWRGGGRIANISSIGGLVSVPHLLPYSASKFALVGLSLGLRSELAQDGIFVSTITPGLMRTGSPPRAAFKGDHVREYAWFAISDSLPLLSVDSRRAAARVIRAIERGEPRVTIGVAAKIAAVTAALAPNLVSHALRGANAALPRGNDPTARRGFESESTLTRSRLTQLTREAAVRNNETYP